MSDDDSRQSVRCYISREARVHEAQLDQVASLVREAPRTAAVPLEGTPMVWIDILDPGEAEARLLRDDLGMHPLAVEDCLRGRQRPKLDRYPGYFFIVFYAANINPGRARMALNEIHIFLGTNYLITVHDREAPEIGQVIASWKLNPTRLRDSGAVAHALLDLITDNYFPIVEHFSDRLEDLEERILNADPDATIQDAIMVRHEMIIMRRILAPQRDTLSSLVRHDLPFLRPELIPYYQDVHDHILRVTEEIDAFRDLLNGLIEIQASNLSNRLNTTVQMLTAWSIILMSVAVIAGVYGMNFDVMPELNLSWGYYGALALMLGTGFALAAFFRRRGWL